MKRLFTCFLALIFVSSAFGQVPEKMSYQAIIRNSSSQLVTNHAIGMKISILQGTINGTAVYVEIQTSTTNANGLVTIEVGGGTAISGEFSNINWANGPYFVKTETDPAGGTNYTIVGTSQLLSVPYALYAKTAGNSFSGDYNDLSNTPTLFSGSYNDLTDKPSLFDGNWTSLTGKPTTLAGYGITDAVNTNGNQIISGNKTFTGTTTVATPVSSKDAVTKEYVDALLQRISKLESQPGIVKDENGNLYMTVKIGTQTWMAENLKTTKYNDGTAIPLVTDDAAWGSLNTSGYCWPHNDEASYKEPYGALYNYYAAETGKLCPTGWHVPTDAEWTELTDYLGGESIAGGKLKEAGTTHWISPNTAATNETGFTAIPGTARFYYGPFEDNFGQAEYWSSTPASSTTAYTRYMNTNNGSVVRYSPGGNKRNGFRIRCVKD